MTIHYKRTQPQEQAFAMAPMVDMVFLLLVFFMCVTAVSGGRARLKIDLPQTAAATAGAADEARGTRIVIGIAENDVLEVNGLRCERAELVTLLRRLRAEQGADTPVRVRAYANAPYHQIAPVLAACRAAGFARIAYAAHEVSPLPAQAESATQAATPTAQAVTPTARRATTPTQAATLTARRAATPAQGLSEKRVLFQQRGLL